MEYILLLAADEKRWNAMSDEELQRQHGAYMTYTQALRDAGVWRAGNRLEPIGAATCVRVASDGKTAVLDGPYADTKEQLGGFYIIDVVDMDVAISWAARCPCATHGTVEVRPIAPVPAAV